ncbi:MAG: BrnA antitoxin family protein [Anaerolineae bacterium]|nr:BrnA antitoxin family protein [Anaerolineae bacterium]
MKMDKLQQRLRKDRPMVTISMRIPEDVVEDLKRIAPLMGFSGYQPLIRTYIGQGLRVDLERFENNLEVADFIESLRRQGVNEEIITSAMTDAGLAVTT